MSVIDLAERRLQEGERLLAVFRRTVKNVVRHPVHDIEVRGALAMLLTLAREADLDDRADIEALRRHVNPPAQGAPTDGDCA